MEFHDKLRTKKQGDGETEQTMTDEELLSALSQDIQKIDEKDIKEE